MQALCRQSFQSETKKRICITNRFETERNMISLFRSIYLTSGAQKHDSNDRLPSNTAFAMISSQPGSHPWIVGHDKRPLSRPSSLKCTISIEPIDIYRFTTDHADRTD